VISGWESRKGQSPPEGKNRDSPKRITLGLFAGATAAAKVAATPGGWQGGAMRFKKDFRKGCPGEAGAH